MTKIKNNNILLFRILFFLELTWLMIDTLSGILGYYKNIFILAPLLRSFIFMFFLYIIFKYYKISKNVLYILISLIILTLIHLLFYDNLENIKMVAKITLPILLYYIILIQLRFNKLNLKNIRSIVVVNTIVFLLNQYLYYLGIGFDNYGIDEATGALKGGTGFFYAGNEVGVTMIALFTLTITQFFTKNIFYSMMIFILYTFAALALMSKTAILGLLLVYLFYLYARYNRMYLYIFLIILGTFTYFYALESILEYMSIIIDRWDYFFNKYGLVYLFGGIKRWTYIEHWFDYLGNHPFSLLWGTGWNGDTENNFFDLVQAFGLLGFIIYLLWIGIFFKLYSSRKKDKKLYFLSLSYGLILVISFFAGHTVQSATLALFIAIIANYSRIEKIKIKGN